MAHEQTAGVAADVFVIFGITGDLAKKMTFRSLYRLERRGLLNTPIIGVAADDIDAAELHRRARAAIADSGEDVDEKVFRRFAERLSYVHGDVTQDDVYERLAQQIKPDSTILYYLEMPPSLFGPIVDRLAKADLLRGARVAVEKPFGHDLASARELNARLHEHLEENQILRVDHFLGKEPVIELEYLRFANLAMANLWDRKSVSCIQITMAEDFGVEDRGAFYDSVGALRDVVQNHLMQVLALVAMDPPAGPSADDIRDKKSEVFRSMPELDPAHCVYGQYRGYHDIDGVRDGSVTETYVALRMEIENWRWADVPIFLRAGKGLPTKVTEVRLFLRRTPRLSFLPTPRHVEANQIVLRIDPDAGLRLQLAAYDDDSWKPVTLDTSFSSELGEPLQPYERLLYAALGGDHQLFARQDGVEETWRIVQPLIDNPPQPIPYDRGSWGPAEADALVRGHHRWQRPWLPGDV